MEHAYKLLFIFRPLVWGLVALLVVTFGNVFLKKLLNAISIFLFALGIIGAVFMNSFIQKVLDPFYFATTDEKMQCIVGSVTVICFLVFALAYFLSSLTVETKDGKEVKHKKLIQKIAGALFTLVVPFAVMGYCLPFFLLDSIVGIIVGVIGEAVGLFIFIVLIAAFRKKKSPEELETEEKV